MPAVFQNIRAGCGSLSALLGLLLTAGCGTLEGGRGWGRDAAYPVQWKRIPIAARNALLDPATWLPVAGAAVFSIDDYDRKTTAWATRNSPVFGSRVTARDTSDQLRDALELEAYGTALITPSGSDPFHWTFAKAKGFGVEYGALQLNQEATLLMKGSFHRGRPDGNGQTPCCCCRVAGSFHRGRPDGNGADSFPSGHTSAAFASARLANRNLDSMEMPPWLRRSVQAGNFTMAGATAWARVEGERHYPSDVLIGAALGNFISTFIHDAFMNLPEDRGLSLRVEPSPSSLMVGLSWPF